MEEYAFDGNLLGIEIGKEITEASLFNLVLHIVNHILLQLMSYIN